MKSNCLSVHPLIKLASISSLLIFLIPRAVYRIAGAKAYRTTAIIAVKSPTLKSITTGIKYTKLGSVCKVSINAVKTLSAFLFRPANMPKGIPIIHAITTLDPQR